MSVLSVIGARPQFVKAAAVSQALEGRLEETVVHTGQHYDRELSGIFFDELDLDEPGYNLEVGSGSQAAQTAAVMIGVDRFVDTISAVGEPPAKPDLYGSGSAAARISETLQVG